MYACTFVHADSVFISCCQKRREEMETFEIYQQNSASEKRDTQSVVSSAHLQSSLKWTFTPHQPKEGKKEKSNNLNHFHIAQYTNDRTKCYHSVRRMSYRTIVIYGEKLLIFSGKKMQERNKKHSSFDFLHLSFLFHSHLHGERKRSKDGKSSGKTYVM